MGLQRAMGGGVLSRMLTISPAAVRRGPFTKIFTKGTSVPDGYGMKAVVPPYSAGNMSSYNQGRLTLSNGTLTMSAGRNMTGTTSLSLNVGAAQLQLIVLAVGSATLTLSVPSTSLQGLVNIAGSTSITLTPNTPVLGAFAGLFGAATLTLTESGALTATGKLEGHILPYTELSPQSLAAAVWAALSADNNASGTMGEKLNAAGSASNPWTDPTGQAVVTQLAELWRIHGLKIGEPMTVTPTSRVAGDIAQTITGDGAATTTVTRT